LKRAAHVLLATSYRVVEFDQIARFAPTIIYVIRVR
jgi:hypothetical protein